jgi:hypothetical protein
MSRSVIDLRVKQTGTLTRVDFRWFRISTFQLVSQLGQFRMIMMQIEL